MGYDFNTVLNRYKTLLLVVFFYGFGFHPSFGQEDPSSSYVLQVGFSSQRLDQNNYFGQLFHYLLKNFPEYKLNTIGRGAHITVAYLNDLKPQDIYDIDQSLSKITVKDLQEFGLLERVSVIDKGQSIKIYGSSSKFLAIAPHEELKLWVENLRRLLAKFAPKIIDNHVRFHQSKGFGGDPLSGDNAHICLLQYCELDINPKQIQIDKDQIYSFISSTNSDQFKLELGSGYLELRSSPVSIASPPPLVRNYTLINDHFKPTNTIGRFNSKGEIREMSFVGPVPTSLSTAVPLAHYSTISQSPVTTGEHHFPSWLPTPQEKHLNNPRNDLIAYRDDRTGSVVYASTAKFSLTDPKKVFGKIKDLQILLPSKTPNTVSGAYVYASSVRDDIKNPGDVDVAVNVAMGVPDHISTRDLAKAHAIEIFINEILSHFRKLARENKIHIIELRVGSEHLMNPSQGKSPIDIINAAKENPYLNQDDVLQGKYVDSRGKSWSLSELIGMGDFLKFKIDLYESDGSRKEYSLQMMLGFAWKGAFYFMNDSALKGIPPLSRTGVYLNPMGYRIGMLMSDQATLVKSLAGRTEDFIMGEILQKIRKDAVNHPTLKFFKVLYNSIIFSEKDPYWYAELKDLANLSPDDIHGKGITDLRHGLNRSINFPLFAHVSNLKRVFNDLREYSERNWKMPKLAMRSRQTEVEIELAKVRSFLAEDTLLEVRTRNRILSLLPNFSEIVFSEPGPAHTDKYLGYENDFLRIEEALLLDANVGLNPSQRESYKSLVLELEYRYLRFSLDRGLINRSNLDWALAALGLKKDQLFKNHPSLGCNYLLGN